MFEEYLLHEKERIAQGIPAKPLDPSQVEELCRLLQSPPAGKETFLLNLLEERVAPGVDPAAKVKTEFLSGIVSGSIQSPLVSRKNAVRLLGTMLGGYNIFPLIKALEDAELADDAVAALSGTILVYDAFDEVKKLAKTNAGPRRVLESWAAAEWFT